MQSFVRYPLFLSIATYSLPSTSGYFSTAFCNAFFANQASINALSTKVIYLDTGGALRSKETEYIYHTKGLLIDAAGNIDANGSTHIGGNLAIDGAAQISGNCTISGATQITGNCNIGGNATFNGTINTSKECIAAGFELTGLQPGLISLRDLSVENETKYWLCPASGRIRFMGGVYSENLEGNVT